MRQNTPRTVLKRTLVMTVINGVLCLDALVLCSYKRETLLVVT